MNDTAEWTKRLAILACEAGESGNVNMEAGFLLLLRASRLPPTLHQGLCNAGLMILGLFEMQSGERRRTS